MSAFALKVDEQWSVDWMERLMHDFPEAVPDPTLASNPVLTKITGDNV